MQKSDYISMIIDNIMALGIKCPPELEGDKLYNHLNGFDEKILRIVAGFNRVFLEHFLIISKGKTQKDIEDFLKKMEKVSYMIGPTGNLSYLTDEQIEYILTKLGSLKLNEITEEKISLIGDEQLEKQFGAATQYDQNMALENQLASARYYLMQIGYSSQEIEEIVNKVRQGQLTIDEVFTMKEKQIAPMPSQGTVSVAQHLQATGSSSQPSSGSTDIDQSALSNDTIEGYIKQIEQEHPPERAQKVLEILEKIKALVKDHMTDNYERVFKQMHPDRLNRAFKMLKESKRKSKRIPLLLEWFFCSHLIENIEFKVEHWQVSSTAGHGQTGVYTAGILFSRYDPIIKEFPDAKLAKVVNIARRILQTPSKRAIQKLGQDLTAETGFDEHLYFTD
ncbi:MAG: hypothetical protein ACP6IY_01715 [Promethearchaeia archaeon]